MPLFRKPRSPYWWYSFNFQGKRYRASTEKTTKTAAAQVEANALIALSRGEDLVTSGTTLHAFSAQFLKWVENTSELQPNSRRYYKYGCRLLNISSLAPRRLDSITSDEIGCTIFRRPSRNGKTLIPCGTSYTLQALRTLKAMFGKAVDWNAIPKRPRVPMPRAVGRDTLIDAHIDHSLETAYAAPEKNKGVVRKRTTAWTVVVCVEDAGMRPDEVFPMRIQHVDFTRRRIWVPGGKTPNAQRFVGMTDRMAELLKGQIGDRKEGWVFPSKRAKCGHLTTIAKGFQAARKRGKLASSIVPYCGRHTFGTTAMEKTGNVFAVSKAMGHGSIKSMEPYQHPNPDLDTLSEVMNQRNLSRNEQISGHTFGHTSPTVN